MTPELRADLLPSLIAQGTYADKLFALGQYNSGLALVGRRGLLEQASMEYPTSTADAWTFAEFNSRPDQGQGPRWYGVGESTSS